MTGAVNFKNQASITTTPLKQEKIQETEKSKELRIFEQNVEQKPLEPKSKVYETSTDTSQILKEIRIKRFATPKTNVENNVTPSNFSKRKIENEEIAEDNEDSKMSSREKKIKATVPTTTNNFEVKKLSNSSKEERSSTYSKSKEENSQYFSTKRHEDVNTHYLPMKGTIYLENIRKGIKKYEGRIGGATCQKMKIGDHIKLFDNRARWGIICEITCVDSYKSFKEMLESKGVLNMLPQLTEKSKVLSPEKLLEEAIKIYQSFPGSERVKTLGAVAIGVTYIKDC